MTAKQIHDQIVKELSRLCSRSSQPDPLCHQLRDDDPMVELTKDALHELTEGYQTKFGFVWTDSSGCEQKAAGYS